MPAGAAQNSTDYNPLNPQPYSPPQLPEVQAPPAPPPQQTSDQAPSQSGPKMLPTTGGKAAGAAYLVSSLLRGIAQGRAQAQIKQVAQAKRQIDGLQWAYNNAAQTLWSMKDFDAKAAQQEIAGLQQLPSRTPEQESVLKTRMQEMKQYQDAVNGVSTSWTQLNRAYQAYFDQGQKKPKQKKTQAQPSQGAGNGGGTAGSGGAGSPSPLAWVTSQDPQEKITGALQAQQKMGPPVMWQLRDYNSPQAKQQRDLAAREAHAAIDIENKKLDLHELQNDPTAATDPVKKAKLERLQSDPELFPALAKPQTPHYGTFDIPGASLAGTTGKDGKPITDAFGQPIDPKQTYRQETVGDVQSYIPSVQRSTSKPIFGWMKDAKGKIYSAEIDPATNKAKPGTENYDRVPPSGMLEKVRTSEFSWYDADGNLHRSQTQSTTASVVGHGEGAGGTGTGAGTTTKPQTEHPLGIKQSPGDRIIGNRGATGQAKSRAEAADSVLGILPRAEEMLKDPKLRENLGALSGRWSEIEKKVGTLDPKTQEFYGILKSVYALNGAMHGWRSIKAPEEFEKAYGDLHTDPDTLLGGLKAVRETAEKVYETGYHHPRAGATGTGDPDVDAIIKILNGPH